MEEPHDTIAELAAVTSEMAEMQDLGAKRLSDLLEKRGRLLRRLIAEPFDAGDKRLTSVILDADRLQERLQKRADSIREELTRVNSTAALMEAVQSTFTPSKPSSVDVTG